LSFIFKVFAKNPPSILFVLAAFALALATYYPNQQAVLLPWVSNFFWAGIVLQVLWIIYKAWESR